MNTVLIKVGRPDQTISLGRRGENEVTEVIFDLTYFVQTYGEGSAALLAKRSNDTDAYPVATTRTDNKVKWVVNNADTEYKGQGKAELFWYIDEKLAKSEVYLTWVDPDIGGVTETPPEPYEAWITALEDEMDDKLGSAQQAVTDAQGYANDALNSAQQADTILASTVYVGDDGNFYIRGE